MKASEFRKLIREEARKALNEDFFTSTSKPSIKDLQKYQIELKFNPSYIGFAWKANGKENYEETSYDDINNFNDILAKVFSEIDYQNKHLK